MHRVIFTLAFALVALRASPAALAEDVRAAAPTTIDVPPAWSDLESPWLLVRRAAERRFQRLAPAEGNALAARWIHSERRSLRRAAVLWLKSRLDADPTDDVAAAQIVSALNVEPDDSVRRAMEIVAARSADASRAVQSAAHAGTLAPDSCERVLLARTVVLFEKVMLDGGMPGFFDGQFRELFELDPAQVDRCTTLASDPRLNFVLRSLAVMSLNEARPPDLLGRLAPMLKSADSEFEILDQLNNPLFRPPRFDDDLERLVLCARISQYVRFSLAKAGISAPIDEKIALLEREVEMAMSTVRALERRRSALVPPAQDGDPQSPAADDGDDFSAEELKRARERAMNSYFDLGYHHQQLDRYDEAERAYRMITDQPGPGLSKSGAWYNLACIRSIQGRRDEALDALKQAVENGFGDAVWARRDGDLKPLHDDPRFYAILDRR